MSANAFHRPALPAMLLFLLIAVAITAPAFFGRYFHNAEEQVMLFSAAYGPRLFYPGSNRILLVLPFLMSWLGTPNNIGVGLFAITIIGSASALALFAFFLPHRMFYAFSAVLVLLIILFFGSESYEFHVNPVQPYLIPFSLSLASCTLLFGVRPRRLISKLLLYAVVSL